jgi:TolA-binding protein
MNRFFTLLTGAAIFASAGSVFAADGSAGVCIDEKAKTALVACSNNGPTNFDVTKHGKAPQVNFHSAPPPADLKKRDQQTKPNTPDLEMSASQRDQRANRLKARQRALLATEIGGLESLFGGTPKNASDRPTLARRLAEDYVELESAAFRDKTNAEVERDGLKKTNPNGAGQKQTQANDAAKIMTAARTRAINYYNLVKNEYPNYPQLDEVLYYLAYEHEQGNDYANARKVYYELIQKRPDSKYIPNAYLAFGELFFNEAQGDPSKWDLSRDAYVEVIKYPPPNNKVFGYAWYKLAYVFWNKGEFEKALNAFKKTIDYGVQFAQLPNASKLADSARRDIIPVYALKGDPGAAYNFFKNISKGGTNEETYKMMDDLGQNYLDTGHYPEAISLYRDLIARDKQGDKYCAYQTHITEATLALKSGNKDAIKNEIDNQIKVYEAFKASGRPAEAKQDCANRTASLAVETGMAWHLEAVGSGGQRGTGDQKTMSLAAYLYKRIVDEWSAQEFATFQFPRIVKEDWPTTYKIKYAMADLLYFQERWADCGPAFDSVVAENPTSADAPEAAYASVLCYQKIYEQTHSKGEDKKGAGNLPGQGGKITKEQAKAEEDAKLKPKDFTDNQKGMIQAFNRYICYIKPGANDTQGQEQLVEVKYARARTYFESQHWEEAGMAFRDIALNNADRDVGIYAAQLYLESVNVVGSHYNPKRPQCFDDMATDVPKFIELYCSADKLAKNGEQCTSLNKIQVDILRLKADGLNANADKGGTAALKNYEDAANAYYELFRRYCEQPIANGQPPQAEHCDEIVYNAGESFQSARLVAKAIRARMTLLNPQYQMDKSPLAKKAMYKIGGNYQAIAVYDQAADWYEKYAKADKNAEKADAALSDAVILRIQLGQEAEAIADAQVFTRNYGASKPAQTAQIAFAVGAHYAEKEDWEKTKTTLSGYMGVIDKAAPDVQAQAHATLARAYTHLRNGEGNAKSEYAKVRGIWANSDDAAARIKAAYPGEDDNQTFKRMAKALNAVGEAYFYAAEEQRKTKVDPVKFPEYKGPGDKDSVLKHIKTKVAEWYKKKSDAIKSVEPDYVKILELKPEPPPKWVIAAGSRSGLMWGDFVDDFRRAPIPEAWKKDADIRGTYYDALDGASQPFKDNNAKPALKKCLDLSVKYQYFDEFSRSCEVWLSKNYKAEYHVVDEIRAAPTLSNSGLDDKPPPLVVGGALYHAASTGPADKPSTPAAGSKSDDDDAKKPTPKATAKPTGRPKKK